MNHITRKFEALLGERATLAEVEEAITRARQQGADDGSAVWFSPGPTGLFIETPVDIGGQLTPMPDPYPHRPESEPSRAQ